jgi:hypothetical protein
MSPQDPVSRRDFINRSLATAGAVSAVAVSDASAAAADGPKPAPPASSTFPYGMLGKARISRLMVGGNLIGGWMHARDLSYVNSLFRAYATDEKIVQTLKLAEECGINTVFETGGNFVTEYNRRYNGHMQFIPHIEVNTSQTPQQLADHVKQQVDTGAVALYVWGVSADTLVRDGEVARLGRAVEVAKKHGLPVGVGGHSLQVPMQCEKIGVPCDFYVKTFHTDDYPSATPKELRKDFAWLGGAKGWYDNMWCLNPEETAAFMKSVGKPWVAFKILAAGAVPPQVGFQFAFKNGADFVAVGMFDFQVKANCHILEQAVKRNQKRERPWRA